MIDYSLRFARSGMTEELAPEKALISVERDGDDFLLSAADGTTASEYAELYGRTHGPVTITGSLRAEDGQGGSDAEEFTLTVQHDASAQFQSPAVLSKGQRWTVEGEYEVYEGTEARREIKIPWRAVAAGERTWHAGLPDGTAAVKCRDHGGERTENWPAEGTEDSGQFIVASEADAASGTVTLAFKTAPDFENPTDDDGDNVYRLRVVSTHDLHGLAGDAASTGCTGSALDIKVRVLDVGPPAQVTNLQARYDPDSHGRVLVTWTAASSPSPITHYVVEFRHGPRQEWQKVSNATGTRKEIQVHPAERKKEVSVAPVGAEGRGPWNNATATAPLPAASIAAVQESVNEGQPAVFTITMSKSA